MKRSVKLREEVERGIVPSLGSPRWRRSIHGVLAVTVCLAFIGCVPPPGSKETHRKQVEGTIAKAGGETNILTESRTLFARLSSRTNYVRSGMARDRYFDGLTGVTNLGDVFHYDPRLPDMVEIRVYNSHSDTYHIVLLNPNLPEPSGFERIRGNVGFLKRRNYGSPVVSPETNRTSSAARP